MDAFDSMPPDHYRRLTDFQLELTTRKLIPGAPDYERSLEEILRRKSERDEHDRRTQKNIKSMTLVILVLTAATLIVTVVQYLQH
jgi:hypothetical protein